MRRIINSVRARIIIRRLKRSGFSDKTREILGDAIRKAVTNGKNNNKRGL